jgi:hypothetical protein
MKKPMCFRVEEEQLKKLKEYELNLSDILRDVLDKILKDEKCPCCGQFLKKKGLK